MRRFSVTQRGSVRGYWVHHFLGSVLIVIYFKTIIIVGCINMEINTFPYVRRFIKTHTRIETHTHKELTC